MQISSSILYCQEAFAAQVAVECRTVIFCRPDSGSEKVLKRNEKGAEPEARNCPDKKSLEHFIFRRLPLPTMVQLEAQDVTGYSQRIEPDLYPG
jgi:hypothetical protein